jgi:hypothetical protein
MPAVAAIFALAGTQVPAGEERRASQRQQRNGQGDARRVGEERGEAAPAEDRESEIGSRSEKTDDQKLGRRRGHGHLVARGSQIAADRSAGETMPAHLHTCHSSAAVAKAESTASGGEFPKAAVRQASAVDC